MLILKAITFDVLINIYLLIQFKCTQPYIYLASVCNKRPPESEAISPGWISYNEGEEADLTTVSMTYVIISILQFSYYSTLIDLWHECHLCFIL